MELDRLLYVACTRARKSLHLIGHVNTSNDGAEMRPPHSGSLLHRLWPALESVYDSAFEQHEVEDEIVPSDTSELYGIPPLRRSANGWTVPAPPKLPERRVTGADARDVDEQAVEFYWVGSTARHAGTIVHRWLHKFAQDGCGPDAKNIDALESMTRRWARDLRVMNEDVGFVCERVRLALSGILADPQGQWILRGEGHAELALTGLWEQGIESIVIDRVRVDDHGVHWIVDYKTSTHEGGNLEEFLQHETERYRQQLQKYTAIYRNYANVPVKAALYFPLLQQFREINIGTD